MKHLSTYRLAPALAAVLVLAACGADGEPAGAPLDTVGTTDASGLRAPTPITMSGSGSSGNDGAVAAEVVPAAASDMALDGDMRFAPWIVEYVVGDGMPALPTADTGYVFDSSSEVTGEQVAELAAALGVAGDPVRIEDEYNVMWRVGPEDGSAPSVWVYDDGQQSWNYNGPWADDVAREVCAVSIDSEGDESGECPAPVPPAGVLSEAEAEARVREYMASLGHDAATLTLETYGDDWFASVDVSDGTDDRAAVRRWSFGFGAEGALQYASGSLGKPEAVGPYPLIDLDAAVERLSAGLYGGYGGVAIMEADVATVTEVAPAVEPDDMPSTDPAEQPVEEPIVSEPLPVDPPEGEFMPAEEVVVTLVDVQADLWWVWDDEGSAWLLPAYRFIDADGGWHVVPAVADEFLIQQPGGTDEPPPVEPPPVEPPPVEPTPAEPPQIEPEPAPEPDDADVDVVDQPEPDLDAAMESLGQYIGLSIDDFTAEAEADGFSTRIVQQDGDFLDATDDYRTDRVNVAVEGNLVVAIESIG